MQRNVVMRYGTPAAAKETNRFIPVTALSAHDAASIMASPAIPIMANRMIIIVLSENLEDISISSIPYFSDFPSPVRANSAARGARTATILASFTSIFANDPSSIASA